MVIENFQLANSSNVADQLGSQWFVCVNLLNSSQGGLSEQICLLLLLVEVVSVPLRINVLKKQQLHVSRKQ